jgi:hypothetical protein
MFMRVNSKCAHHVRPPLSPTKRKGIDEPMRRASGLGDSLLYSDRRP